MPRLGGGGGSRGRQAPILARRGGAGTTTGGRRSTRIQEIEESHQDEAMDLDVEEDEDSEELEEPQDDDDEYNSEADDAAASGAGKKKLLTGRSVPGKVRVPGTYTTGSSPTKLTKKAIKAQKAQFARENQVVFQMEEMVQNTLLYMLLMQHRKVPVKRADIMKQCVNSQAHDLPQVLSQLDERLTDVFGMKVVGLDAPNKHGLYNHYILLSSYNLSVSDMVTPRDQENDCRRSLLFLILTVIFMTNGPVEEDDIWRIVDEMKFSEYICRSREGLHRYLKVEYVTTMYLQQQELKDTENPVFRYSWGLRAEKEFSRWQILKFVSKQFPGRKPDDFIIQYGIAKELEGDKIEEDLAKGVTEDDNVGMMGGQDDEVNEDGDCDELLSQADTEDGADLDGIETDPPPPEITIDRSPADTDPLGLNDPDGGPRTPGSHLDPDDDETVVAAGMETMVLRSGSGNENNKDKHMEDQDQTWPQFLHFPVNEDYACPPTPGTSMGIFTEPGPRPPPYVPYPTIYDDSDED